MTKKITATVPDEMADRVDKKSKEGPYGSKADYIRAMIRAGESRVADLDPRIHTESAAAEVESLGDMVEKLGPKLLLGSLTDTPQDIEEVIERSTNEFQSELAYKLDEMAKDDKSSIQYDPMNGYYISSDH